ncbi:21 kDa subunit of NADH dehydrogenase [Flagelloscypha sp. PMI_526]|nr:21 kDa subunit of NADH dehydrogenase [Flagelloscypha sp. PMI_526]
MSGKKALEELYHVAPKGFWKRFRETVSANPTISSGLPLQYINRQPPPASRPEKYHTPATKASDPAQNPYWKRDVRRKYPRLSVIGQTELASLLIEHIPVPQVTAGEAKGETKEGDTKEGETTVTPVSDTPTDLVSAITLATQGSAIYGTARLPPVLPTAYKKWVPVRSEDPPHAPHSDFPMFLVH